MLLTVISTLFLIINTATTGLAANVDKASNSTKCSIPLDETDNKTQIEIGQTWDTADPCLKYICILDQSGQPLLELIKEECRKTCRRGFEVQPVIGKCCGPCVKTKCLYLNETYSVGDTWHNEDDCMLFECILQSNAPVISAFKKTCPELPNCEPEDIYTESCCQYCRNEKSKAAESPDQRDSMEHYDQHPCKRECIAGAPPMLCEYKFHVEWYQTLSRACYDCPFNETDCHRTHCVSGDGVRKSIIVVNRSMPGPAIEVCLNDTVLVDVTNGLLSDSTSLHWHGLHQKETPYMDGVPNLTQCPIIPYTTFRYMFRADNSGTHFWHSHVGLQRGDGCFGSLIIRKPDDPHLKLYDYDLTEHIVTMQDWIHTNGITMFTNHHHSIGDNKPVNILVNGKGRFLNPTKTITDPIDDNKNDAKVEATTYSENDIPLRADSSLKMTDSINSSSINIKERLSNVPFEVFHVKQGSRYRFRTINSGFLNCPIIISVDNHTLLVIQSDGYDLEPIEVTSLVSYAGERFDFVVNANQEVGNYWMRFKGIMDCDERFGNVRQVAIIRYDGAPVEEPAESTDYDYPVEGLQLNPLNKGSDQVDSLTIAEISALDPDDDWLSRKEPDYKFYVYYDFNMKDHSMFYDPPAYGFNNATKKTYSPQLNHISLKIPPFPLLSERNQIDESIFCNETSLKEQGIDCRKQFCECHHVLKVPLNSIVEMVLVDEGHTFDANHPFHLHGYAFRVIGMDRIGKEVTIEQVKDLDSRGLLHRNFKNPAIKDTVTVPDGGYSIIRFKADNPGYWLFHCHIEFHAEIGMALILKVGENSEMIPVPKDFPKCSNYMPKLSFYGNGNGASMPHAIYQMYINLLAISLIVIYLL